MTNILHIIPAYIDGQSAMLTQLTRRAIQLRDAGVNLIVCGSERMEREEHCFSGSRDFRRDGVSFKAFDCSRNSFFPWPRGLYLRWRLLTEVARYFDKHECQDIRMVIVSGAFYSGLPRLSKLLRSKRIPLLGEVCEYYRPNLYNVISGTWIDQFLFILNGKRLLTGLLACSEQWREVIRCNPNTFFMVPGAVSSGLVPRSSHSDREPPNSANLVYMGRINSRDRILLIFRVLRQLKRSGYTFNLLLIGSHDTNLSEHIISRIAVLLFGGSFRITETGYLPDKIRDELLSRSDLAIFSRKNDRVNSFVVPSRIVDFLRCGCPVVMLGCEYLKKYYPPDLGVKYIDESVSVDMIAQKIGELLGDRRELSVLGHNGYRLVKENFTYPGALKGIIDAVKYFTD